MFGLFTYFNVWVVLRCVPETARVFALAFVAGWYFGLYDVVNCCSGFVLSLFFIQYTLLSLYSIYVRYIPHPWVTALMLVFQRLLLAQYAPLNYDLLCESLLLIVTVCDAYFVTPRHLLIFGVWVITFIGVCLNQYFIMTHDLSQPELSRQSSAAVAQCLAALAVSVSSDQLRRSVEAHIKTLASKKADECVCRMKGWWGGDSRTVWADGQMFDYFIFIVCFSLFHILL